MDIQLTVTDWALDYGDEKAPPVIWLQTATGSYLKPLECAEAYEEHMVTPNAMLLLTARIIERLDTPHKIQEYIDKLTYDVTDDARSVWQPLYCSCGSAR